MRRMPGREYVLVRRIMSSSQSPGAYGPVHTSAGLHIRPTAHLHYLLDSEFQG